MGAAAGRARLRARRVDGHAVRRRRARGASSTSSSREPESLARSLAACLRTVQHPKLPLGFDAILVVGPEHARVFAEAGWTKAQAAASELTSHLQLAGERARARRRRHRRGRARAPARTLTLPKFRPGGLLIVHAGGGAGLFSAIIGGWANGETGSQPVDEGDR